MLSCDTTSDVFVAQEDMPLVSQSMSVCVTRSMSPCEAGGHVSLCHKRTCLLVKQEDAFLVHQESMMCARDTRRHVSQDDMFACGDRRDVLLCLRETWPLATQEVWRHNQDLFSCRTIRHVFL